MSTPPTRNASGTSMCGANDSVTLIQRIKSKQAWSIRLWRFWTVKRLVYTGGTNNLNVQHNKAMAIMNLMMLHQEKFQDIHEFRDQCTAMKKVCNELGLKFDRCKDDARVMLKEKGITQPTTAQLKVDTNKVEEALYAILFLYKTDKSKYRKLIKEMENDNYKENIPSQRWYLMHTESLQDGKIDMAIRIPDSPRRISRLQAMRKRKAIRRNK